MTPYYYDDYVTLYHGDCREIVPTLGKFDLLLTDPPYGLRFMGKAWDYDVPDVDLWRVMFDALKPGAHLLAFAGTRTQHRMAVNIEDADFEIRDMIAWVYGSGFPKSLDVSKAIDKAAGAERKCTRPGVVQRDGYGDDWDTGSSATRPRFDVPATDAARQWDGWGTALKPSFESLTFATKPLDILGYCAILITDLTERIESCRQSASNAEKSSRHSQADSQGEKISTVQENAAIHTGEAPANGTETGRAGDTNSEADISASISAAESFALNTLLSWRRTLEGVSDAAKMSTTSTAFETITDWKILSFCLSQITPADIIAARFNPSGLSADALRAVEYLNASLACCSNTLALSVLAPAMSQEAEACRGVGAQPNLDPCIMARKPFKGTVAANVLKHGTGALNIDGCRVETETPAAQGIAAPTGRWPSNFIHDGSDEVVACFPDTGASKSTPRNNGEFKSVAKGRDMPHVAHGHDDNGGSAARYFYCAKSSKSDRGKDNNHPTVKPVKLMQYLITLGLPPCGVLLDPFAGSGTTGRAAKDLGRKCVLIEREEKYCEIAARRMSQEVLDFGGEA